MVHDNHNTSATIVHLVWVGQTEGDREALDSIHASPASANDRVLEIHHDGGDLVPTQDQRPVHDVDGDFDE